MFQSITFYIGGKTLGIYGEEFPLGALTTEVLNITPEEYQALDSRLQSAMEGMARYEKTHTLTDWHQANEQMLRLNEALCHHHEGDKFSFSFLQKDNIIKSLSHKGDLPTNKSLPCVRGGGSVADGGVV